MCVLPSGRGFGLSRPPSCISSKEKDTLWTYREHKEAVRTQQSTTGNMFTAAGTFTHQHTNTDSTRSYLLIKTTTTTTQIWVVKSHKNLWVLPQLSSILCSKTKSLQQLRKHCVPSLISGYCTSHGDQGVQSEERLEMFSSLCPIIYVCVFTRPAVMQ